jgi:hypothetical protein
MTTSQFDEYLEHGWLLTPLKHRTKVATQKAWNLKENAVHGIAQADRLNGSAGLLLAHCDPPIGTIDLDDFKACAAWFDGRGIDLSELLMASNSVQIKSGRLNRGKLLYRLPKVLATVKPIPGLEFRCGDRKGGSVQDVLPPSIHPGTGEPYVWQGDWQRVPNIPPALLSLWQSHQLDAEPPSLPGNLGKSLSDQSAAKIERALDSIRPDCEYSDWIKVGQAIYAESAGSSRGMALWESWSIRGKKHEINECAVKWGTFSVEGVSIGTLYYMAKQAGGGNKGEGKKRQGETVELHEPAPWRTPVDGAAVLTELVHTIQQHMAMREPDAITVALWCAHTYCYETFSHTPRLAITAPAPECGKTVLLAHLIGNLVNRPQSTDNMSPAAFFRMASAYQPTFLVDEVDAWLREDSDLPGAINGGFERHGSVIRCVGDSQEVRQFKTHCPVAFAGINLHRKLPPATLTRSVVIELARALPGEVKVRFNRRRHQGALRVLAQKLVRWVGDNESSIRQCRPQMPQGVENRHEDKWMGLLSIASVAGGDWPDRVKTALLAESAIEVETREIQLLYDINRLFALYPDRYTEVAFTGDLIRDLCELDGSPWADYNFRGRMPEERWIKDQQVARMLAPYHLQAERHRCGSKRLRGYLITDLKKVVGRYLGKSVAAIAA